MRLKTNILVLVARMERCRTLAATMQPHSFNNGGEYVNPTYPHGDLDAVILHAFEISVVNNGF